MILLYSTINICITILVLMVIILEVVVLDGFDWFCFLRRLRLDPPLPLQRASLLLYTAITCIIIIEMQLAVG